MQQPQDVAKHSLRSNWAGLRPSMRPFFESSFLTGFKCFLLCNRDSRFFANSPVRLYGIRLEVEDLGVVLGRGVQLLSSITPNLTCRRTTFDVICVKP